MGFMLMPRKTRIVTIGEIRAEYPEKGPLLMAEQRARIASLAKLTGLSEEEICRRLVAAAQPSIDKVIDAALRLMVLQSDSLTTNTAAAETSSEKPAGTDSAAPLS